MPELTIYEARSLDAKGRCCGRKPLVYRREGGPHRFCARYDTAYGLDHDQQIANWAWLAAEGGGFVPRHPKADYVRAGRALLKDKPDGR